MPRGQPFAEAYREARAEGRERGKNVHLTFVFRRHEEPGKTPEGGSADFLTDLGKQRAKERGKGLAGADEYLMVAGSRGVKRARETGGLMLGAFRDEEGAVAIVNREMSAEKQRTLGHGEMPPGDVVIYRSGDLDPVKKFGDIAKAAKAQGAADLQAQIQWWLDHPDQAQQLGAPTSEDVAAEFAHRLGIGMKMSGRLLEGLDMRFENLTHGPKPDAFLKEVMVREGKRGFDRLEDIGGMFQPGEEMEFDVKRDAQGQASVKIHLRGQEYAVDMARLEELQRLYQERQSNVEKKVA